MVTENTNICPKVAKCPIFQEGILINKLTGDSYKNIYCTRERYTECKRFIASQKCTKPIPVNVLPNSFLSIDEIIKRVNEGYWDKK
ncbi:MAG: hypothetical protein II956_06115 [Bacteroidales bacterium]|nr:hypothetical protein [Bacteroidales bacterium]